MITFAQWWIVRTIWQGFGELFLEDMTNALAVIIVLMAFITLNVILLNLLIAMMSGTFETIKLQAKGQGMIEQCGRIKEFSRTSLGTPPFFNIFVISWDIYYFFKNLPSMQVRPFRFLLCAHVLEATLRSCIVACRMPNSCQIRISDKTRTYSIRKNMWGALSSNFSTFIFQETIMTSTMSGRRLPMIDETWTRWHLSWRVQEPSSWRKNARKINSSSCTANSTSQRATFQARFGAMLGCFASYLRPVFFLM